MLASRHGWSRRSGQRISLSTGKIGLCPVSDAEFVVVFATILVASSLQSAVGFGLGLLAAPVLGLIEPTLLPGTIVLLATGATVIVAWRERSDIDFRDAGWALLGRFPGTAVGAALVAVLSTRVLVLTLAVTVICGVLLTLRGWRPQPRRATLVGAGAVSGLLGTATSIGGPPMALVWHDSGGARLRGTMSAFFLVGSLSSLIALSVVGAIDGRIVRTAAALAPAVVAGYIVSRYINRYLDSRRLLVIAQSASVGGASLLIFAQMF